jgi:hypothetical protein
MKHTLETMLKVDRKESEKKGKQVGWRGKEKRQSG